MLKKILGRLALACLISAIIVPLAAHELGTSHVAIDIAPDGRYTVAITADAAALLARLERLSGAERSSTLTRDEYAARVQALAPALLEHVAVRFDDVLDRPSVESVACDVAADAESEFRPPTVRVTLAGSVPSGAKALTWRYGLTTASYAVTIRDGGPEHVEWVEGDQATRGFALRSAPHEPTRAEIIATYLALGYTHILPRGLDHILFVLGLFLFGRGLRPILWQVSAFTVAHSITLGLALYGLVSLPSSVVEPLIAVSIVYVAFENLFASELRPWRVALVFGFGLLHGLGFAGVLQELALPRSEFLTGLVSFNIGVEAGQLTVIAVASLLVAGWTRNPQRYRRLVVLPGSAVIALIGAYWTVMRTLAP